MRSYTRPLALALVAALLVPLAGCATGGTKKADTSFVARDVDTLYNGARSRLDRGQYKQAAALFDEVERQHPYSIWARRAQLMSTIIRARSSRRSGFCRSIRAIRTRLTRSI